MPIAADELKYFESTDGLGGAFVPVEVPNGTLHNLFDPVVTDEALLGDISYRCIYLKNSNLTLTLSNALVFILADSVNTQSHIEIGLGTSAINGSEQTIPDEYTAPVDVVFSADVGDALGLLIGDMPADSSKALWIKRVIDPNSNAIANDNATVAMQGDTA